MSDYDDIVKEGPTIVCNCCGGLWFRDQTATLNKSNISAKYTEDFANETFALSFISQNGMNDNDNGDADDQNINNDDRDYNFCKNCHNNINKDGKFPNICLNKGVFDTELREDQKGLHFPKVPEWLKGLTVLEERLCAPRIPFMRICSLGYEKQIGLKGAVVNIPVYL